MAARVLAIAHEVVVYSVHRALLLLATLTEREREEGQEGNEERARECE